MLGTYNYVTIQNASQVSLCPWTTSNFSNAALGAAKQFELYINTETTNASYSIKRFFNGILVFQDFLSTY